MIIQLEIVLDVLFNLSMVMMVWILAYVEQSIEIMDLNFQQNL